MTEKRYGMSNETGAFIDKKFNKEYTDDEIIDLLNELNEENEQLKQQLKTKYIVNKQYEELQRLKEENEQLKEALIELKEIGDYQYARIKELSDENEELEQTNQRLTIALKEIKEKTNIYLEMTKKGEDQP